LVVEISKFVFSKRFVIISSSDRFLSPFILLQNRCRFYCRTFCSPLQRWGKNSGQTKKKKMKYCLIGALLLSACLYSCKKTGKETGGPIPATLTGKWNYAAYYFSIGGPGGWHPANEQDKWIQFKEDGSFSSNLSPFNTAIRYHLTDSVHVQFITAVSTDSSLFYSFSIDTVQGFVSLSPARPMCIEGCAQKFTRQLGQ